MPSMMKVMLDPRDKPEDDKPLFERGIIMTKAKTSSRRRGTLAQLKVQSSRQNPDKVFQRFARTLKRLARQKPASGSSRMRMETSS